MSRKQQPQLFPPEIMENILRKLDKPDLLNCRAVCQSWNQECLHQLEKLNVTQAVSEQNIRSYTDFVLSCQQPRIIFPLNIYLNANGDFPRFENNSMHPLVQMTNALATLSQLIGSDTPVEKLTLKFFGRSPEFHNEIIAFLKKVSPGLRYLDLSKFYNTRHQTRIGPEVRQRISISFPELRILKIDSFFFSSFAANFICRYIPNPSTLESLTLLRNYRLGGLPNCRNLNEVVLEGICNCLFSEIHNLFARCRPRIRKLSIHLSDKGRSVVHPVHNMRSHVIWILSANLESFEIFLADNAPSTFFNFRIPRMPKLKSIRIHQYAGVLPQFFNSAGCNFTSAFLPVLECVDIPVGYFLCTYYKYRFKTPPALEPLPTVKQLTLRVSHRTPAHPRESATYFLRQSLNNLFMTFPSLIKLVVINNYELPDKVHAKAGMEILMEVIIRSTRASTLEEVVIINSDLSSRSVNFLGDALRALASESGEKTAHNLTSVKTIILEQCYIEIEELVESNESPRNAAICDSESGFDLTSLEQLDFDGMLNYFPGLRFLHISRLMFGTCTQSARTEYIDRLAAIFPNVSVLLI